jgi:hypothetical protein
MAVFKKSLAFTAAALLIFAFLGISRAQANNYGTNITIYDTMVSGSYPPGSWYNKGNTTPGGGEDQEVEPGMATGQAWDLEGFYLNNTTLTMIGGYNFKDGVIYKGHKYTTGDLFIAKGVTPPLFGVTAPDITPNSTVNNVFGYDYVIHFNFTHHNYTFTIYAIGDTAKVKTVTEGANDGSSPWKYVSGGTLLGSGSLSYAGPLTNAQVNANISHPEGGPDLQGGCHYVITLDLADLLGEGTYYFHYTYECGNDLLMGQVDITGSNVPLPPSLLLLGSGLVGLVGMRWRQFKDTLAMG